jgi:hypothetical protein
MRWSCSGRGPCRVLGRRRGAAWLIAAGPPGRAQHDAERAERGKGGEHARGLVGELGIRRRRDDLILPERNPPACDLLQLGGRRHGGDYIFAPAH